MTVYQSDKERLVAIEVALSAISSTMTRIEHTLSKHITDSEQREKRLEDKVMSIENEEGTRLKGLKYKIVEYVIFAILGGVITYVSVAVNTAMK
jgi:hypothetical protein